MEYDERISENLRESKTSYEKREIKNEIIIFLFVLTCNFTRTLNGLLMKYIEEDLSRLFRNCSIFIY